MKEINIAHTIISKRHKKGITQDELASYMGVSKASVSKWETGQSYPDISLLPHLASFFNVTIDELMDYSPQMVKKDIRKTYHRLAANFTEKPFDDVLDECQNIIKKYYSCFPLLLQMALLLLNHINLVKDKEKQAYITEEISRLCIRIKSESEDYNLSQQANSLHAMCFLIQGKPAEVIDILENCEHTIKNNNTSTLSNAYLALGNEKKAKEILQINAYAGLLSIISSSTVLLALSADDQSKSQLIINRMEELIKLFDLENLHINTVLIFHLTATQNCVSRGDIETALDHLEKYASLCCSLEYPLTLHSDWFFDGIDEWFETFELGNTAPTEEKTIKSNMLESIIRDPVISTMAENDRYKTILKMLETNADSYSNRNTQP